MKREGRGIASLLLAISLLFACLSAEATGTSWGEEPTGILAELGTEAPELADAFPGGESAGAAPDAAGMPSRETYPWQVVRTEQEGDAFTVWYVTNQAVNQMLTFTYGGVPLEQMGYLDNSCGIGYIFVLDSTQYNDYVKLDPATVVEYALKHMTEYDQVAFVSVNTDVTTTDFLSATEWNQIPEDVMAASRSNRPKSGARLWDGIVRAVDLAIADTGMKHHVIVVVTDGEEKGSLAEADSAAERVRAEGLPIYALVMDHWGKERDATPALLEFGNTFVSGGSSTITADNYKMATDTAIQSSGRLYRTRLKLDARVLEAENRLLTIAYQGGRTLAVSNPIELYLPAIPTFTPVPQEEYAAYIGYNTENRGEIQELHRLLKELGYYEGEVTSVYTDETEAAVQLFYQVNGRTDKPRAGGITKEAFETLRNGTAAANPEAHRRVKAYVSAETEDEERIRTLNQRLYELGYLTDEGTARSGRYTDRTEAAVRQFYITQGLTDQPEGGGISEAAYWILLSGDAISLVTASPSPTSTLTPTPSPTPKTDTPKAEATPTVDPNLAFTFQELNSEEALAARDRLIELGYMDPGASMDENNFAVAVRAFCQVNGLTYRQGQMSREILEKLMSVDAIPAAGVRRDLRAGDDSETARGYIREIQEKLKALGYLSAEEGAYEAGTLDEPTEAAIRRFAEITGMEIPEGELILTPDMQLQILESTVSDPEAGIVGQAMQMLNEEYQIYDGIVLQGWILAAIMGGTVLLILILIIVRIAVSKRKKKRFGSDLVLGRDGETEEVRPDFAGGPSRAEMSTDGSTEELFTRGGSPENSRKDGYGEAGGMFLDRMEMTADESTSASDDAGEEMNLVLSILEENGKQWELPVFIRPDEQKVIGREGDIRMPAEDRNISRRHGTFSREGDQLFYEDHSTRGTIIDGQSLNHGKTEIRSGAEMRIGHCLVRIRIV